MIHTWSKPYTQDHNIIHSDSKPSYTVGCCLILVKMAIINSQSILDAIKESKNQNNEIF